MDSDTPTQISNPGTHIRTQDPGTPDHAVTPENSTRTTDLGTPVRTLDSDTPTGTLDPGTPGRTVTPTGPRTDPDIPGRSTTSLKPRTRRHPPDHDSTQTSDLGTYDWSTTPSDTTRTTTQVLLSGSRTQISLVAPRIPSVFTGPRPLPDLGYKYSRYLQPR